MVYLDSALDLDEAAVANFNEIAETGSSEQVNVAVEMDRPPGAQPWSDTRRFFVKRGGTLSVDPGQPACHSGPCELNMGDRKTLADFISWAKCLYPARHYALIIWGHGTGVTFFGTKTTRAKHVLSLSDPCDVVSPTVLPPAKAVAPDDEVDDYLYNAELAAAIGDAMGKQKLDLIGFDACLMSTVETAFAVKDNANVMVGSEQNEPQSGWNYQWLRALVNAPTMDGETLSKVIVRDFCIKYHNCDRRGAQNRTLAAVRLDRVTQLTAKVNDLSVAMEGNLRDARSIIDGARAACSMYGEGKEGTASATHNIDLACFAAGMQQSSVQAIRQSATAVLTSVDAAVISNFADRNSTSTDFGSRGVAIHFPRTHALFCSDAIRAAYDETTTPRPRYPITFIYASQWDNFLAQYHGSCAPAARTR